MHAPHVGVEQGVDPRHEKAVGKTGAFKYLPLAIEETKEEPMGPHTVS